MPALLSLLIDDPDQVLAEEPSAAVMAATTLGIAPEKAGSTIVPVPLGVYVEKVRAHFMHSCLIYTHAYTLIDTLTDMYPISRPHSRKRAQPYNPNPNLTSCPPVLLQKKGTTSPTAYSSRNRSVRSAETYRCPCCVGPGRGYRSTRSPGS